MMPCASCEQFTAPNAETCEHCGAAISTVAPKPQRPLTISCEGCGHSLYSDTRVCPNCKTAVTEAWLDEQTRVENEFAMKHRDMVAPAYGPPSQYFHQSDLREAKPNRRLLLVIVVAVVLLAIAVVVYLS